MTAATKWTIAIVVLLGGNITAMVALTTAANTSKAQVIPDYYDHAAHYDDALDEATRSVATGWTAEASLSRTIVEVSARDQAGRVLDGAVVRVTGYPRAHAANTLDTTLLARGAGRYAVRLATPVQGAFDLRVTVERDGQRYVQAASLEAAR